MALYHKFPLFSRGITVTLFICLVVGFVKTMSGCVCFSPIVKQVPDTRPGKEGQTVVVHDEMPLPCKIFWGALWGLSWLFPGKSATSDNSKDRPGEYTAREASKAIESFNREYIEADKYKRSREIKYR